MNSTLTIIRDYYPAIISGLAVTVEMCLWIWGIGMIAGSLLGMVAARYADTVGGALRKVHFLLGGVPALVLLYWTHYPLQEMLHVVIPPIYTAIFALAVINVITVAEVFRHEASSLLPDYLNDAKVCGLSDRHIFVRIQLPLILLRSLPNILGHQVKMLHLTLFAGLISVEEIFRVAQRINSVAYKPVEIYTTLGLVILLVSLGLTFIADWIRRKYSFNQLENVIR